MTLFAMLFHCNICTILHILYYLGGLIVSELGNCVGAKVFVYSI